MGEELKHIKELYGEKMAHICRKLFPSILEEEGILSEILEENIYPYKFFIDDVIENNMINDFFEFISSKFKNKILDHKLDEINEDLSNIETPEELMKKAGYTLYECKTEKDIQKFRKYYKKDEELCTFKCNRLETCFVFFAVKDNAMDIYRKPKPERQDEYGTSVISIQFSRENHSISIKNRYNHTVGNPDATFSNNLDNIIEGLTDSFRYHYGYNIKDFGTCLELPNYVRADDGRFYKYNVEIHNTYYCPDNIIIENGVVNTKYHDNKEKYIIFDYFILDLQKNHFGEHDKVRCFDKTVIDGLSSMEYKIDRIEVTKSGDNKKILLHSKDKNGVPELKKIVIDKCNRIVEYSDLFSEKIPLNFLAHSEYIKKIDLPNAIIVDSNFLRHSNNLKCVNMPRVESFGDFCLEFSNKLEKLSLPKLRRTGVYFLDNNEILNEFYAPELEIGNVSFLSNNQGLKSISFPKLRKVGNSFLFRNTSIRTAYLPSLEIMGSRSFYSNRNMNFLYLPSLKSIGHNCFNDNENMSSIFLPKVEEIGIGFLLKNKSIKELCVPNLRKVGESLMPDNNGLVFFAPLVSKEEYRNAREKKMQYRI